MPYSKFTLSWAVEDFELILQIDLTDYPLLPVDNLLGVLIWMLQGDSIALCALQKESDTVR
jgi:hypothetical protein